MSELAKKAAAIASAKRAKLICKSLAGNGPLGRDESLQETIEQFGKNSVGRLAFSGHSATATARAARVDLSEPNPAKSLRRAQLKSAPGHASTPPGSRQRFSGLSQARQWGDDVFLMLVTGNLPDAAAVAFPSASPQSHARCPHCAPRARDSLERHRASAADYRRIGSSPGT